MASAIFASAALYISLVEHPARMAMGISATLQEFRSSYKRAAPMQASLAFVCFVASAAVWLRTHQRGWLVGGAIVVMVIPFTFAFMMRVNHALLDSGSPPEDGLALSLLSEWARLHAVRTTLGLVGFVVLLVQVMHR
jgi:anthrone oxygenase-like protein